MFDWKILVAVFLTLWGLAIGMAHGAIDISKIGSSSIAGGKWGISDLFSFFTGESEIPIHAEFNITKFPITTKIFRNPVEKITVTYASDNGIVMIRGSEISSPKEEITLTINNFKGLLEFGETISFNGFADSVVLGDISLKGVRLSTENLRAEKLEISGLPKSSFEFENIKGKITSSGTGISIEDKPLSIKGFKGEAEFVFTNSTYYFDGTVSKLLIAGTPLIKFTK